MDSPAHPLSLKVMRVSRPTVASAWEPFFSSSPSFSTRSTASILSLQGEKPLPGHPKTLRDLTHATDLLTLPSSFGAIQLGETFASCLCINNEANIDIESVSLKVEMQTATSKLIIGEFGGAEHSLAVGETLECVVNHEIKELGQHVLACTVSYQSQSGSRFSSAPGEDGSGPTFRKFYKFAVTNPLSVKTKVHTARSPSALLSRLQRERIFLEVHIQNMTQDALWFERMLFECADGWTVDDVNVVASEDAEQKESIFTGSLALMQPQDMRQYVYILTPTSIPSFPVTHPPGSTVALGRLDLSWRSSFGEPGRLLTSMLSRRIPLTQPQQPPASALPLHLQRNATISTPSRPHSPQPFQERPGTPPPVPYRPASPFRNRPLGSQSALRSQSPGPMSASGVVSQNLVPPVVVPAIDIDVDLVVRHIPHESIHVETPFTVSCTLTVSSSLPRAIRRRDRVVSLVVQHLQAPLLAANSTLPAETFSPRLPSSGFTTPSPTGTPMRGNFNYSPIERRLMASPHQLFADAKDVDEENGLDDILLPLPCVDSDGNHPRSRGVVFLGPSAIFLPPLRFQTPQTPMPDAVDTEHGRNNDETFKAETSQDFDLSYLPLTPGFSKVGGLRILLLEDDWIDEDTAYEQTVSTAENRDSIKHPIELRVLKEMAEVWVKA